MKLKITQINKKYSMFMDWKDKGKESLPRQNHLGEPQR